MSDSTDGRAQRLVDFWRRFNLTDRPPASEPALDRLAAMYDAALPDAMRAYLRLADGMDADGGEMNEDRMIRFWPVAEIGPARHEGALRACFEFADYLLDSHRYGVFLGGPHRGQVVLIGGDEPTPIADSIEQFIDYYLDAPGALFPAHRTGEPDDAP
ncbi:MAG: SMI1/KNR4 family protein [Deltaproteobacteria bacterium]|nr:SMI1/KNR4 family protein [Deltaproteobacteria bacterium]